MAEYVTIPDDPHQHVFELIRHEEDPNARFLINRSYPLERQLEAMKRDAKPLTDTKRG